MHGAACTQFLEAIDRIMAESSNTHEAAAVGQMSLFGGPGSDQWRAHSRRSA